jgi:hypothetical protein
MRKKKEGGKKFFYMKEKESTHKKIICAWKTNPRNKIIMRDEKKNYPCLETNSMAFSTYWNSSSDIKYGKFRRETPGRKISASSKTY